MDNNIGLHSLGSAYRHDPDEEESVPEENDEHRDLHDPEIYGWFLHEQTLEPLLVPYVGVIGVFMQTESKPYDGVQ